jgi:hypothetical protein
MELIDTLISELDIPRNQAEGGAGLIFKLAKEKLSQAEYSKVAAAAPEADSLISSAPSSGGALGELGGLLSGMGGGASSLGSMASLAGGFSKLGLSEGTMGKFLPIVLNFLQSKGGASIKDLLAGVFK